MTRSEQIYPKVNISKKQIINMDKRKETEWIRLKLDPDEDKPLYDYFITIKNHLGLKVNTETARYCIKKTYEQMFGEDEEKEERR